MTRIPNAIAHRTRARRARASRTSGFTLIEVMIAAGIILVGAVGIMALQQAATRGNREAREMMTATTITQSWIEVLGRCAYAWRTNSVSGTANVPYLSKIAGEASATKWFVPDRSVTAGWASDMLPLASRDYHGGEPTVASDVRFCSLVRLTWLNPYTSMRAEVITWWPKDARSEGATGGQLYANCGAGNEAAIVEDAQASGRLHAVYGSTVLRWNGTGSR